MSSSPAEIRLNLAPRGRFDTIDVRARLASETASALAGRKRSLYTSFHTTAGYLDRALAARLAHHEERLRVFINAFRGVFPQHAPYQHDQMELRQELSAAQKQVEPRNGDSHLTFIGAGMRNCVTYANEPAAPCTSSSSTGSTKEGDGSAPPASWATTRRRWWRAPASWCPCRSIRSTRSISPTPAWAWSTALDDLLGSTGIEKGRVDITLEAAERDAGLTVNEYETLLMRHDLAEVLKDPLRFAKAKAQHVLEDPLAVPGKALSYARYDVVRVMNQLMEAFRVERVGGGEARGEADGGARPPLPPHAQGQLPRVRPRRSWACPPGERHLPEPDPGAVAAGPGPGAERRHRRRAALLRSWT